MRSMRFRPTLVNLANPVKLPGSICASSLQQLPGTTEMNYATEIGSTQMSQDACDLPLGMEGDTFHGTYSLHFLQWSQCEKA